MYRFLLSPKWIVSHVLILGLIVAMTNLMLWQLRRLDEKQDLNARITARADVDPIPLPDLLVDRGVTSIGAGDAVEYQATTVTGVYLPEDEFTVPSKTLNGAPGRLLVTPLRWSDVQPPILVLRGFIPQAIDDDQAPIDGVEPPAGEVSIRGWLRPAQEPEGIQSKKAQLGPSSFARIDIERIEMARGTSYVPVYLQLGAQQPRTDADLLSLYPLPERSEGPHFSYAAQWGIFTIIAIIGYPLVIRRVARGGSKDRKDDVPLDGPPPPGGYRTHRGVDDPVPGAS